MLKVSSRGSSRPKGGESVEGKGDDGKTEGSSAKSGSGETDTPDIAGGRSIFVSMEKLEHELTKARKRRRPNTMYKSKEDALRGVTSAGNVAGGEGNMTMMAGQGGGGMQTGNMQTRTGNVARSTGLSEAVMRLERLKAMSNNRSKM